MPKILLNESFLSKAKKLLKKYPDKKTKIDKTIKQLTKDPFYPSLQTKKYDSQRNIWQSYVEQNTPSAWRIWWTWSTTEEDTIIIDSFGPHP